MDNENTNKAEFVAEFAGLQTKKGKVVLDFEMDSSQLPELMKMLTGLGTVMTLRANLIEPIQNAYVMLLGQAKIHDVKINEHGGFKAKFISVPALVEDKEALALSKWDGAVYLQAKWDEPEWEEI
ncbi:MAG: hypothetical protein FWG30_12100 [Eubacteriaceae bacterium]|nr:hypothetical protein [Eubacteriaceae bacterium]